MNEKWLPIPGFEGTYEVSDHGNVRSLDRMVPKGELGNHRREPGRMLRQRRDGRYLKVSLYVKPVRVHRRVHRLVLEAFVGPCPPGMEALHGIGGGTDNRLENLRWGTRSENCLDIVAHGKHHLALKTHCKRGHKFTPENTYIRPGTKSRKCRACHVINCRAYLNRRAV